MDAVDLSAFMGSEGTGHSEAMGTHSDGFGIHRMIEAQVGKVPHAIAAVLADEQLTYAELNSRANQLARHLQLRGLGQGGAIALFMDRSLHCLVAILAAIKAGAAYVPIDTRMPADRVAYILGDSGAVLVLVDQHGESAFRTVSAPVVTSLEIIDVEDRSIYVGDDRNLDPEFDDRNLVYCIYTSGSTGKPKGVMVHHRALINYVRWAQAQYVEPGIESFALYSSLAFDLTVTSIFVPLVSGLCIHVYPEGEQSTHPILRAVTDNQVEVLKLTPAHLQLVTEMIPDDSRIRTLIVGGEDLKVEVAAAIHKRFPRDIAIYNEYGPTETAVGCMIYRYDPASDVHGSVPIGVSIDNVRILVLDAKLNPVKENEAGEIFIAGDSVALGYRNSPEMTSRSFLADPFYPSSRMYSSGDLARRNDRGQLVMLGRKDFQLKLRGYRVEPAEVENVLIDYPGVMACTVSVTKPARGSINRATMRCKRCGLASNVPNTYYSEDGICNYCLEFDKRKDVREGYFANMEQLVAIAGEIRNKQNPTYDCLVALSGGKDSTYVLCRVVDLGLRVLAFTLDNGYLSDRAKGNIANVVKRLGVDHRYLSTQHMDAIFADSLKRHSNVCNGCFKTIYTMAIDLAIEVGVTDVVLGLSKGQLFETRMSELFREVPFDLQSFEKNLISARKIYHQVPDAVNRCLPNSRSSDPSVIEKIRFVDFYRYCHVTQEEMYRYIKSRVGWERPSDTGRSTNCLMNDVGILVHNTERGYHNYSIPYAWDVRLGHIDLQKALRELDDVKDIDLERVHTIMKQIGYEMDTGEEHGGDVALVAYYVSSAEIDESQLREHMAKKLPEYMVPVHFVRLATLPLTPNGKVNRQALPRPQRQAMKRKSAPSTPVQQTLLSIWKDVLSVDDMDIEESFFQLGGQSVTAMIMLLRVETEYKKAISPGAFVKAPTIAALAALIE